MSGGKIKLGLGIIAFIVGFIFLSLVSWSLNTKEVDPETITVNIFRALGAWSLIGLALISIGIVIILLVKLE
ncbi:MAG: hypothetical protein JXA75_07395 [Candidatus Thermoplasmatota archaeon]|nr:hypothetical protein [Candidatus Thermoplasmatota archaeon]